MAVKRRYGLFMVLAAMGCPLLLSGIAWASPAQADATSYLQDLHGAGIQEVNGDAGLLQTGQRLCVEVGYGATSEQLKALALQRSDARQGARGLSPEQANELVNYAIADLCPNY